jgi:hypothetical protein
MRAFMIPLRRDQAPPPYQQDAIIWLQQFKNTELLQQMLWRFHFSEAEIAAYRISWSYWLKPKPETDYMTIGSHGGSVA